MVRRETPVQQKARLARPLPQIGRRARAEAPSLQIDGAAPPFGGPGIDGRCDELCRYAGAAQLEDDPQRALAARDAAGDYRLDVALVVDQSLVLESGHGRLGSGGFEAGAGEPLFKRIARIVTPRQETGGLAAGRFRVRGIRGRAPVAGEAAPAGTRLAAAGSAAGRHRRGSAFDRLGRRRHGARLTAARCQQAGTQLLV